MKIYIDYYHRKKGKIYVRGWGIGKTGALTILTSGPCKLTTCLRSDINRLYALPEDAKTGFEITSALFKTSSITFCDQDESQIIHIGFLYFVVRRLIAWLIKFKKLVSRCLRLPQKFMSKSKEIGMVKTLKLCLKKITSRRHTKEIDYHQWRLQHVPAKEELANQRTHPFVYNPKFSIIVPTFNTPIKYLREMIDSVKNQTYQNWELCIADGASSEENTIAYLKSVQSNKIKVSFLTENLMISGNTNEALQTACGDYIVLLDHDDLLTADALFEVVKVLNEHNEMAFIYSDEDKINQDGKTYSQPHFKPDIAIDNLRSYNYITHLAVIKKTLLDQVGLFDSKCDGAQDHDMFLRLFDATPHIYHIPKVLYHWRIHKASTSADAKAKEYVIEAGKYALQKHMERNGIAAHITTGKLPISYKVNYDIKGCPLVSILILNKDHVADLKRCIHSITAYTQYVHYEIIIIENNSEDEETFTYYKEIADKVVIQQQNSDFNYSALNNYGRQFCNGEYIILLNNDIEVISRNWIEELLMQCQRAEVGAVGAKLYYPDDTVQHAGVIIGVNSVAGHAHKKFDRNDFGYMGRLQIVQDCSAVTGACMMVKASIYDELHGLDEKFKVAFNDVDFCLRIREKGYLIVFTPYAELYHYESLSRGAEDTPEKVKRFNSEIQRFEKKWGLYRYDPYYNVNLTITMENFSLKI